MAVAESQDAVSHDKWLRERRKGIGASEVGTILGLNPYSSPYELWCEKTGQLEGKIETLPMKLGHLMEPVLHRLYEEETGRILFDPGEYKVFTHPEHDWLRCTPDRLVRYEDGEQGAVELKTASMRMADQWHDGDAPLGYQVQLQIQLACLDLDQGEIAGLIGNDEFLIFDYCRNDEFLDAIIPAIEAFWQCVQSDSPPEVDGSDATTRALKALHPLDNGQTVQLPGELARDIKRWERWKAIKAAAEKKEKEHNNRLIAALGDNTFGEVDGLKISHKAQTRRSYTVDNEKTFRVLRKVGK